MRHACQHSQSTQITASTTGPVGVSVLAKDATRACLICSRLKSSPVLDSFAAMAMPSQASLLPPDLEQLGHWGLEVKHRFRTCPPAQSTDTNHCQCHRPSGSKLACEGRDTDSLTSPPFKNSSVPDASGRITLPFASKLAPTGFVAAWALGSGGKAPI